MLRLVDNAGAQSGADLALTPDRIGDDPGWEPVTLVADGLGHAAALKLQASDQ
jgi:hypothetical protein